MKGTKSKVELNLSNQANTNSSKKTDLFQYNCFAILGLGWLESESKQEDDIPVSIEVSGGGKMTIKGLDEDIINDGNIRIYSDRKVTTSED